MTRRGKRTGRLPDLSIEPADEPTPAELCPPGEDHNEEDDLWVTEQDRVFVRRRWWRGRLIEFAMTHRRLKGPSWVDVIRADTCHRQVHIHVYNPRGEEIRREVIVAITDEMSVEQGYDVCNDRVLGQLEANVRQWQHV